MKEVTELKDGMKVWIPFDVKEVKSTLYTFILKNVGFNFTCPKNGEMLLNKKPLEMYEQEEIPALTPVEMEVSDDEESWVKKDVVGKIGDSYVDSFGAYWLHARPIKKTVTLEIPESELTDELRKYLKR